MSSNLPPGVTDSMLPGNRAEDRKWEALHDAIDDLASERGWSADDAHAIWMVGVAAFNAFTGRRR